MVGTSSCRPHRSRSYAGGLVLACWTALGPVHATENAGCRELERRFDLIESDIVPTQLNSTLFSAADVGCAELARKLLAAGASLEAWDRFGTAPLAHAARAGQRALVDLLLARGAQIDARGVFGATALYLAAENERHATVTLLLEKGASLDLPGRFWSHAARGRGPQGQ